MSLVFILGIDLYCSEGKLGSIVRAVFLNYIIVKKLIEVLPDVSNNQYEIPELGITALYQGRWLFAAGLITSATSIWLVPSDVQLSANTSQQTFSDCILILETSQESQFRENAANSTDFMTRSHHVLVVTFSLVYFPK